MKNVFISSQQLTKLGSFRKKYTELYENWGHYLFACHAAFPMVYTPDLLYQLWFNFQVVPDEADRNKYVTIDRMAVSDLILSDLSQEIGSDLYQMDKSLRDFLLSELRRILGNERVNHIASFLYHYADWAYQLTHDADIREIHQWTAMATLNPQQLARELGQALSEAITHEYTGDQIHLHEMLQKLEVQDEKNVLKQLTQVSEGIQQQLYGNLKPGIILDPVAGEGVQRIKIAIPDLQIQRKERANQFYTPNLKWNLVYFEAGKWWIDFGATVDLLQVPLFYLNIDILLIVDDEQKQNSYHEGLPDPHTRLIGKARTRRIEIDRSELEILNWDEEPDSERSLKPRTGAEAFHLLRGEITGSSIPLMEVWLNMEDEEMKGEFQRIISDFTLGSPFYLLFTDQLNSRVKYSLEVKENQILILEYPEGTLIHGVEGLERMDMWYILTKLEQIARWERILGIYNDDERLDPEKFPYYVKEWMHTEPDAYNVSLEEPSIIHEGPMVKLVFEPGKETSSTTKKQLSTHLDNQDEIPVYVYLIALTPKYGIQILPHEYPVVEPGQTYSFNITYTKDEDIESATEHIKAIISSDPLDLLLLEQESLNTGEVLPAKVERNVKRNLENFPELPEHWLTKTLTIYQEERPASFPIQIQVYPYPEDKAETWKIVRQSVGLVRMYSKGEEAPIVHQGFLISKTGYFLTSELPSNYQRVTFQTSAMSEPVKAKHTYDFKSGPSNNIWFSLFKLTEEIEWPFLRLFEREITTVEQVTRISVHGPASIHTEVEDSSFHPELNSAMPFEVYYSKLDYPVQIGLLMAPVLDHQTLRVIAAMNEPIAGSSTQRSDCYTLSRLFNEPDILQIEFLQEFPRPEPAGPKLKLEVPRPTIKGINYRDLLKAIGKNLIKNFGRPWASVEDISQQTRDLLLSSRRAANDGQDAYLLIFESLVNTCLQIIDMFAAEESIQADESQIDILVQDLDAYLQSRNLEIDRHFFHDPSPIASLFELTFQNWLMDTLNMPYSKAREIAGRIPGLFKSAMVEEFQEKQDYYLRLEAFFGATFFDYQEIRDAYTKALQTNPNNAHAHVQRAKARKQSPGNYARILEDYKRAVELEPNNFDYLREYANWLEKFEEYELAYETYQNALQRVPNWEYGLEIEHKISQLRSKLAEINPSYNPFEAFSVMKDQVDRLFQNNNLRRAVDVVYQFFRKLQDQEYFNEIQEIRNRFRDGEKAGKLREKQESFTNDAFYDEIEKSLGILLEDYEWTLQQQEDAVEKPIQTQRSESINVDELTTPINSFREEIVGLIRRNQHGQAIERMVKQTNSLGIRELNDRARFLAEDWQSIQRSRSQNVLSQSYVKDMLDQFENQLLELIDELGNKMMEKGIDERIEWLSNSISELRLHETLLEDMPDDMSYKEIEELIEKLHKMSYDTFKEEWLAEIHSEVEEALEIISTTSDFAQDMRIPEGAFPEEIYYDLKKGFTIVLNIIEILERKFTEMITE